METESEVFLNKHAHSTSLLLECESVPFQSRLNDGMQEVVYQEFLWYGLFVAFSLTTVYPTMVGEKFQIHGVQI